MFPSPSAFPARRYGGYHAINFSSSFQTEGSCIGAFPSTTGTLTQISNLTKPYLELTTSTTSGTDARIFCGSSSGQLNFFGANPAALAWVKTGPNTTDIQNVRIWADALAGSTTGNSDALPANSIAFRFSTVAGDTNWMCVTSNASGTNSAVSSGVAVTSNTEYLLSWYYLSGTVYFFINGNPVLTTTTDVPSTSAGVYGYPEGLDIWTQTAAACNGYISAQYVAQD
jgi:hypothetical protein